MAENESSDRVDEIVSKAAGVPTEKQRTKEETTPIYRMDYNSKIPVSKYEGPLWKARRDAGRTAMKNTVAQWKEAEAYYSLGQDVHRQDVNGGEASGNERAAKNRGRRFSSTENIVYSNVNAILPSTIAKNPQCEITSYLPELKPVATVSEHLVNRLATMKHAPGFNLKPKLKKCILRCEIMNEAWVMVGYTRKEESAEQARADLMKIGKELEQAKNPKEIKELEGKLQALEEVVDILNPSGPFVRAISADKVITDPTSMEDDFSDANWKMVEVMLPTYYLLAKYSKKNEAGSYEAVYRDKYIINPGDTANTNVEEFSSYQKLTDSGDYKSAGFDNEDAYKKSVLSKCWYCFDKVKRRFLLFADENFEWPLWVYDDPYQLPSFFPLKRLQFHSDPNRNRTKGEVSHYLDQQDEINTINSELHWMRTQLKNKVIFNAKVTSQETVDQLMKGVDDKAVAIKDLPDGMKLSDVISAPPLPNLQYKELFDKTALYSAIDRIGVANDVIRGAQFKTNTTNDAIGTYNSIQNQRLDERIDAIEDFSGDIFYDILFLCAQFMTAEEVQYILGTEAEGWKNMPPEDIRKQFACTVLGGSTQKPTSAVKKEQALKVGQILGQFANASPYVIIIMLNMLQDAFDDIVITDKDWQDIKNSIQMKLMQGTSGAPGPGDEVSQPGVSGPPPQGQMPQGEEVTEADTSDDTAPQSPEEHAELEAAIAKLPPEASKVIAALEKKGMSRHVAFASVVKELGKRPFPQKDKPDPTITH